MSILLYLAGYVSDPDNFQTAAADGFVRRVDNWSLDHSLGGSPVFRCILVDKRTDKENAYRPKTDLRIEVRRLTGAILFRGRIAQVSDAPLEEPNVGTKYSIACIGESEVFDQRHVTATFGGDPVPIQISYVSSGGATLINTFDKPHLLSAGDEITIESVAYPTGPPSEINGTTTVLSVPDATHFYIPLALQTGGNAYGGTVRKRVRLRTILQALEDPYLTDYGYSLAPDILLGPLLEVQKYEFATVADIYRHLSKLTGWVHRFLPSRVVEFFEPGTKLSSLFFQKQNVLSGTGWTQSRIKKANTVILRYGGNSQTPVQETLTGRPADASDSDKRKWTLVHKPVVIKPISSTSVQITLHVPEGPGGSLVPRHVGVKGYDTTFEWVYDESGGTLEQLETVNPGAVPTVIKPPGWSAVAFITEQLPATVTVQDDDQVELYGPREKVVEAQGIIDRNAAIQVAQAELRGLTTTPKEAKFVTEEGMTWPGNSADSELPHIKITGEFLLTSVSVVETERSLRYTYTGIEGNEFTSTWQEKIRSLFGGSGNESSVLNGNISTSTAGGGGGGTILGTQGKIPVFTSITTIGDSALTQSGDANLISTPAAIQADQGFRSNVFRGITAGALDMVVQNAAGQAVFDVPNGTRNARFYGSVVTNVVTSESDLELGATTNSVYPTGNYQTHLGGYTRKWLSLHAAELWVEMLVAQEVLSTIGGNLWVGPTTVLEADLPMGATSIVVKHNQMSVNDRVMMKGFGKFEIMVITGGPTGTGPYTYTVTRNYDGSGVNEWVKGDAIANTGQTGSGHIEIYSVNSARLATELGPTQVFNVRTGTGATQWEPRVAVGNLRALYGYASNVDTYGIAAGVRTGAWFSIDPVNGFRIMHNNSVFAQITAAGSASFTGSVTVTGGNAATTDLANVTTGTVRTKTGWGHPSDTTRIDGATIYTGTVNLSSLNFTPVTTTNVVASINATAEGIRIQGNRINIDGTVVFGAGYDPSSKIALGGAASDINANTTTISGGKITTGTITADKLNVGTLSAITANMGTVTAGSITGVTISGSTLYGGSGNEVTINSSGLTLAAGGASVNSLKWSNGVEVRSFSTGTLLFNAYDSIWAQLANGCLLIQDWNAFGPATGNSNSNIDLGRSGGPWHSIYMNGDLNLSSNSSRIFWDNPPTTSYQDEPLVWSVGNHQIFRRNDTFTGTVPALADIEVRGGLITGWS